MTEPEDASVVTRARQEQMLRLVAKGFYNELVKYGVSPAQVLTVAGHLLDNVNGHGDALAARADYYNRYFSIKDVRDEWETGRRLALPPVSLRPLDLRAIARVAGWLRTPAIRDNFYPLYPATEAGLTRYFQEAGREYFFIFCEQEPVGIIGAEQIDEAAAKLEMRKLVGDPGMHGKGIGKRATMLFLYYVFVLRKFRKVYVHSLDINVRNLNLNAGFGFQLEGTLFEDALIQGTRRDVVRMALTAPAWLGLFS
jgi:RimJ/RimL family protein N-acetyltransferase